MDTYRRLAGSCLLPSCLLFLPSSGFGDSTVVFNEIMYHPFEREAELEWIELHNQMSVDMDISGWFLADGVHFVFPEGTIVQGGGFIVAALSSAALEEASGYSGALGPFAGRLDNGGERLDLRNNSGRLMDSVRYRSGGEWPVAADGSGVSLAKIHPDSGSADASNWTWSAEIGGTPGGENFPVAPEGGSPFAPSLLLSESVVTDTGESWTELLNAGTASLELAGHVIASHGPIVAEHVLDEGRLDAGAYHILRPSDLGFGLVEGARLFLYSPDRARVLDGIRLETGNRGRAANGSNWYVPEKPTPGAANVFRFRDEIVINEIMYHHRPHEARPPTVEERELLPVDAAWRYEASGADLGDAWWAPEFDDSAWEEGQGLFYNEAAALPGPKTTLLPLGPRTYYFRTEFTLESPEAPFQLFLRPVVDDGAVFYVNGSEVLRVNMPDGPIRADTLASRTVGNAFFTGPFEIPLEVLSEGRNVFAVEVHQRTDGSDDVVFGLVLELAVTVDPGRPFAESREAWVELLNRGDAAVDLGGWRLDGGIRHTFAPGTMLASGEYIVAAADPRILEDLDPDLRVVEFEGRLSHRGEELLLLDELGNPADEVQYQDGGRWPEYADGGGSSLELRSARADNARAEAWAASDEASRSSWKTYSYRATAMPNVGPAQWREFVLGLLDAGEVLLDEISVIEAPHGAARELIQNGTFEEGDAHWRLLGNHGHSEVIPDPENPENRVLHLIATGPTEHMHNHAETTVAGNTPVRIREVYEVSFRARWLAGSNQLHTRLYFNLVPRTTLLDVPERNGTPGTRNSAYEENIGPTFHDVGHRPAVPEDGEEVEVTAGAEDPDGIAGCRLWWRVDGGVFAERAMELGTGGLYRATIPGHPRGTIVQFYVEAEDSAGRAAAFPALGPDSRALYKVNDRQARPGIHNFRIIMTNADTNFLHLETNVMSNDRLGATVVYDEREVFYDAGVRLKGSERGRPVTSRVGFSVRFQPDHLFRDVHRSIHIDRSGGWRFGRQYGQDEILVKHIVNHAGNIPGMYDDLVHVIAPRSAHTGSALLLMARFGDVFLDSQWLNGSDGTVFEYELIYYPTSTINGRPDGLKRPQPDSVLGTDLRDLGDDKEAYRWNFLIENNRAKDDYSGIMALCKSFSVPLQELDASTRSVMDIDQWMRTFAMYSLCGIGDTYTFGNNHNNMHYVRPEDGKVLVFPWDMDFAFVRSPTDSLWGDQNLSRVIQMPGNTRVFYWHLQDIIESTFHREYMARWVAHYGALARQDYSSITAYIEQRRQFVLSRLPRPVEFAIQTNDGEDFAVEEETVIIEGDAGIDVRAILLADSGEPPDFVWRSLVRWRTTVPLNLGANELTFLAFNAAGELIGSDTITVTTTAGPPSRFIRGDVDLDGRLTVRDPVMLLTFSSAGRRSRATTRETPMTTARLP